MPRKSFWTPTNTKRLDALIRDRKLIVSIHKAARLLNTSPSTVHVEIKRRSVSAPGHAHKVWTPGRLAKLKLLLDGNGTLTLSHMRAATVLGCDRHSIVAGLLILRGQAPARFPLTATNITRLKALTDPNGHLTTPVTDAAQTLGCSVKTLKHAMKQAGITTKSVFSWTPEKLQLLHSLMDRQERLTLPQASAAQRIGCSHRALQMRLALPPGKRWQPSVPSMSPAPIKPQPPKSPPAHQRLRALCKNGVLSLPIPKAATRFKVTEQTIRNRLKAIGAKPPPTSLSSTLKRDIKLKALCRNGQLTITVKDAAKRLHCMPETLRRAMKRLRIKFPPRTETPNLRRYRDQRRAQTAQRRKHLAALTRDGVLTVHPNVAAARLKCRPRTIINDMRALNLRSPKTPNEPTWNAAKEEKLRALCARGRLTLSVAQAAARLAVSPQTLDAHLARLGIMHVQTGTADIGPVLAVLREWIPKLSPMQVARAADEFPALAAMTTEQISVRAGALSRALKVTEATALSMALSAPGLFTEDVSVLRATLHQAPRLIGIGPDAYHSWVCASPRVLLLSPEAQQARINDLAAFFHVDLPRALLLLRRTPHLLAYDRAALEVRAEAIAAALSLPPQSISAAARRQANLVLMPPNKLASHCATVANLLGITTHAVAKAFIANPSLLQVKPASLATNVRSGAELLGCDRAELAAAYLLRPALLTMRPTTIASRVQDLASIFGLPHVHMVEKILKRPYLLTFTADNTREKAWLLVKLSEAVDRPMTPAEILAHAPMAFTYAKERIAARVEMAREGIGPKSLSALLSIADARAAKLVTNA